MPARASRINGRGRAAQNLRLASTRRAQEEEKDEEAEEEEDTPTSKRVKGRKANEPTEEKDEETPAGKKSKTSKRAAKAEEEEDKEEEYAEGEDGEDDDMEDDVDARATAAAQNVLATERKRAASLRAEFSDDPKFALKAIDKGWSVTQAKAHYADVLRKRAPGAGPGASARSGNQPLTRRGAAADMDDDEADYEGDAGEGAAAAAVNARIRTLTAKGMSRQAAHSKVMRDDPDLRERFVEEHNQLHRATSRR